MTRINVIHPRHLHDKHLLAEYRELPRIFNLAEKAYLRGETRFPNKYCLGQGHVKFFYNKLGFLTARFIQLLAEMQARGWNPQYVEVPNIKVPESFFQYWTPMSEDIELNLSRLKERKPEFYEIPS